MTIRKPPQGKPTPQSSTQSPAEEASSNSLIFQPILIYTSLLTFHYSLKHFRQPPTPFMKVSCGRFFSYTILLLRGLAASVNSFAILAVPFHWLRRSFFIAESKVFSKFFGATEIFLLFCSHHCGPSCFGPDDSRMMKSVPRFHPLNRNRQFHMLWDECQGNARLVQAHACGPRRTVATYTAWGSCFLIIIALVFGDTRFKMSKDKSLRFSYTLFIV